MNDGLYLIVGGITATVTLDTMAAWVAWPRSDVTEMDRAIAETILDAVEEDIVTGKASR